MLCHSHSVQVRAARAKTSAAAIAASIAAEGYDSDEEVYATAKALEGEGEEGQDDDIAAKVGARLVFGMCKTTELQSSRASGRVSHCLPWRRECHALWSAEGA